MRVSFHRVSSRQVRVSSRQVRVLSRLVRTRRRTKARLAYSDDDYSESYKDRVAFLQLFLRPTTFGDLQAVLAYVVFKGVLLLPG